jgi:hypothetical protein
MGRRSRKRGGTSADPQRRPAAPAEAGLSEASARPAAPVSRRARLDEAPAPPWAPVPLTEILILLGLVALGFALLGDGTNTTLLAIGLVLVTLATLELALREHLAGYRSHSALLAGLAAILVAAPLALFARPAKAVVLIAAAVVFALGVQIFREIFRRRSGGMGWRA